MTFEDIPAGTPCTDCKEHLATDKVADSVMDYAHGHYEMLCKCCLIRKWNKQIRQLETGVGEMLAKLEADPCMPK